MLGIRHNEYIEYVALVGFVYYYISSVRPRAQMIRFALIARNWFDKWKWTWTVLATVIANDVCIV